MSGKNLQGIWTQYGQERMAAWMAGGKPLTITVAAVGNGGGVIPDVSPSQKALVGEEWRGLVNGVRLNPDDATDVIVEVVLPNEIGGFWIREWGLFDDAGKLVAVGPHDEMHKPLITQGQAAEILELFHLPVSNSGAITLTIVTQALATQQFVASQVASHDADTAAHNGLIGKMDAALMEHAVKTLVQGAHGFPMGEEGQILSVQNGRLVWINKYELGEFYFFRHPSLRSGFMPAQGGLLENAATLYPEIWAYLQTAEGQLLCKTEAEWQALTVATWHANADGTKIGWNGIGGAPFYAPNTATGALRLPDLRGMYAEAAGFDALGVGDTHGDAIRPITGDVTRLRYGPVVGASTGPFTNTLGTATEYVVAAGSQPSSLLTMTISRVHPTANKVQPRAWGALACVYLGRQAS